jgi:hypothetical protein
MFYIGENPRDTPKWHIRKCSVFGEICTMEIFRGFQSKSADFYELFPQFWDFFDPKWLKIR